MVDAAQWTDADTVQALALNGFGQQRVQELSCSVGPVVVKGLRPARGAWRAGALNFLAALLRQPALRAAPVLGGVKAQATEIARLRSLAAAGAAVPRVWWVGDDRFAMQALNATSLSHVWHANEMTADEQLELWQLGAHALMHVHANGNALSQAFARNMLWHEGRVWFIDFEDDPLQVMDLASAQLRDWLAYLHSSVYILRRNHPDLHPRMLSFLEQQMSTGCRQSAKLLMNRLARLSSLRHLPSRRSMWGRDIVAVQALGQFLHEWLR